MINIQLGITNPWYTENFENLFNRSGLIGKHKAWEFEVTRYSYDFAKISFRWTFRKDHAGPSLELCLLGYSVQFQIYDGRHWDYENGCWEVYKD